MALMIGCIWHGLDALQGTRAKPGNHLVYNHAFHSGPDYLSMQMASVITVPLSKVGI